MADTIEQLKNYDGYERYHLIGMYEAALAEIRKMSAQLNEAKTTRAEAFRAGQRDMQERAVSACIANAGSSVGCHAAIRALPIKDQTDA